MITNCSCSACKPSAKRHRPSTSESTHHNQRNQHRIRDILNTDIIKELLPDQYVDDIDILEHDGNRIDLNDEPRLVSY